MMKSCNILQIKLVAVIGICLIACSVQAIPAAETGTSPCQNDGKKWRIGYYQGGAYSEYQDAFLAIVNGLAQLGWIGQVTPPSDLETNRERWEWLAQSVDGDCLQFVGDAFYSADWEKDRREKLRDEIIQRLNDRGDIDLMMAGHTHGMQFGVETRNFRWSPVQYMYDQWAGMYTQGNQHLYVNRGFGYLGFPGRVGMPPEITIIELRRA